MTESKEDQIENERIELRDEKTTFELEIDRNGVSNWRISNQSFFTFRYVVVILGFFAFFNLYTIRVCLSYAIQPLSKEFSWSVETQGYILSSFFIGYTITQIPGGLLAGKYGGKYVMGLGVLISSILTLTIPLSVRSGGIGGLVTIRILIGLSQGVTYPAMHSLFSLWAPIAERSRMISVVYSGAYLGTIATYAISGPLEGAKGWESIFYLFGSLGILWSILWMLLSSNSPDKSRFISMKEQNFIIGSIPPQPSMSKIPWGDIFRSRACWALITINTAHNWAFYLLLTWLPTFLTTMLGLSSLNSSLYSVLPYLAYFVVFSGTGFVADYLIKRGLPTTTVRKGSQTLAYITSMITLVILGYTSNSDIGILLMTLSVGGLGFCAAGYMVNHLDIAPTYSGILMGISSLAGTIPGIIAPSVTGLILGEEPSIGNWRIVFWICAGIYTFGILIYATIGSSSQIRWEEIYRNSTRKSEINVTNMP